MRYIALLRLPAAALSFALPVMLPALCIALYRRETAMYGAIALPLALVAALSIPVLISFKKHPPRVQSGDGFFVVTLTWLLLTFWGALPYLFGGATGFTAAVFESAGAFATTGATTISDVEALPQSLIFWRFASYWIGGMGIILLTVAFMPLLGAGGFQLVKAETTGADKEKITAKVTATAKVLWLFYFGLTLIIFILYKAAGMTVFDALCHAFSTVSTGGISTKNAGFAFYHSPYIDSICIAAMFLSAVNFNLYYRLLIRKNIHETFYNTELHGYILVCVIACAAVAINVRPLYESAADGIRAAVFQTVAVISTGGITVADYTRWPAFAQTVLFFLMLCGGCSGSTAGGIKIIRHIILFKQAGIEMRRLIYPRGVFSVRLNRKAASKDVVYGAASFVFVYSIIAMAGALLTAAAGFDLLTSVSASLSVINNTGLAFGALGPGATYAIFPAPIQWLYIFMMIIGRIEIWTFLILFRREYWR